jgi:protein-tyrosine phosphatase
VGRTVCCCVGGHGRTGTALAALMLATDPQITAKESINNVRKLHCENAIESDVQEKYLAQLEIQRNKMLKEKSK